jgi:hypothetical protein
MTNFGKCYGCIEFSNFCSIDKLFKADCPRTCGTCDATKPRTTMIPLNMKMSEIMPAPAETTTTTIPVVTPEPKCEDKECVESWLRTKGECFKCDEHNEEFCGRDADFMASCPKTCKTCMTHEEPVCEDDFKPHICKRHVLWGNCVHRSVAEHCKGSCELCQRHQIARAKKAEAKEGKKDGKSQSAALRQQAMPTLASVAAALLLAASIGAHS